MNEHPVNGKPKWFKWFEIFNKILCGVFFACSAAIAIDFLHGILPLAKIWIIVTLAVIAIVPFYILIKVIKGY